MSLIDPGILLVRAALAAGVALFVAVPPPDDLASERAAEHAAAIRETIGHYFKAGDRASSAELRRAFHPAAMMFSVAKDGSLAGVSQPDWWARLDANKSPTPALSRKITILDIDGDGPAPTVAAALVVSEYPAFRFEDYMSLLRIGGSWKIVGKIFHRTEPAPPAGSATAGASDADRDAIRSTAVAAARGWDGGDREALAAFDRRATTYSLEAGELVGVSVPEREARLEAVRRSVTHASTASSASTATAASETSHRVTLLDASGDAALAKVETEGRGAARRADYLSLLKQGGAWRVVGAVSIRRDGTRETRAGS
jgi:hypothetical protein